VRLLPYGPRGLLVELDSATRVTAAYRLLRAAARDGRLPGVAELVPAARTVLVELDPGPGARPPAELIRELLAPATDQGDGDGADAGAEAVGGAEVVLPVHYDGADLDLVARTAELTVAEVVRLHSEATYTVAFCGFAPGFGYLTGLPEPLRQPRLDDSRPSVPAGSVGVAGEFTGVYPRSSPGGWRLIGRTEATLFDPTADPPARLAPGDRVRFEPA
jgi:KipI family sensor histidine kinase inhibitor